MNDLQISACHLCGMHQEQTVKKQGSQLNYNDQIQETVKEDIPFP